MMSVNVGITWQYFITIITDSLILDNDTPLFVVLYFHKHENNLVSWLSVQVFSVCNSKNFVGSDFVDKKALEKITYHRQIST